MTLAYIFIGLFSVSFIFLLVLIISNNNLKKRVEKLTNAVENEIVKITHRTGFYDGHYTIGTGQNSKYNYRVYITELEKYENGFSRIQYDDCTVTGFNSSTYSTIKHYVENDFLKVRPTKDITWLEVEKDLAMVRKEKLERILDE